MSNPKSRETGPEASDGDPGRREAILIAAQSIWIHYGFRRTSMEEIAAEAGISRSGLYHHFRNKEAIFRALATALQEAALQETERVAKAPEWELEARLVAMLQAKLGRFHALFHDTRHGQELIDESSRLCGEEIAAAHRRYQRLIASVLESAESAGELSLARRGLTPSAAADFLIDCGEGLKGRAAELAPHAYAERLEHLVAMALSSWRPAG